ncbi:alpha/beta fold hydrolase [Croceicoccus naphthovorans]|uniref:Alpha/beta hydrolase n=1 Tax=Croceicoccus naphthovorans TaxID=1348774 RepID=A0A0G3XID0_9SPHN|nr:alpha/beta hydrolase [Croceicoccus naphthovorans]AKM10369.1 alpha/beta hydrolase [Croceicoccus naphthovorans]MBB3990062.1 pimeloyl-ACP methyl ester carboxylesterase [Croceicoccus naphthovorans]
MVQYREHRYRSADGRLDLFARDYPAGGRTDGAGEGAEAKTPLLLMHGLTRNSADFEPLVPHLADWRLIVPDQRGRGLSDNDDTPENYRVDVYMADMLALLDSLGIDRCAVIGTSMGGLIGMGLAATAPDRLKAMVLNDIGPVVDAAGLARITEYVGPSKPVAAWADAAGKVAAINADAFPGFDDRDWLAFAQRTSREGPEGISPAYDPAIALGMTEGSDAVVPADLWPLWDSFGTLPVLSLRGALSDLMAAETQAEMERRHAGPFVAVEVPQRGHAPLLDEPEVLAALLPFLHEYAR